MLQKNWIWIFFIFQNSSDIVVTNFASPSHEVLRPPWPQRGHHPKTRDDRKVQKEEKLQGNCEIKMMTVTCTFHRPHHYHQAMGQKVGTPRLIMALLGGLRVAFLQESRIAWDKGAEMCDWKCNEQVMKASIMGWLEAGTLILFDTDCEISGEESVKALGNEEKPFGGLEREEWVHG